MNEIIKVYPDKCVGCNACIRVCPTTEANVTTLLEDGRFVTTVNADTCINCGECVSSCQHGARHYEDDTDRFVKDLSRLTLAVLVTPAIKTVYPTSWKGVLNWLKKSGATVYDVSFGAEIGRAHV